MSSQGGSKHWRGSHLGERMQEPASDQGHHWPLCQVVRSRYRILKNLSVLLEFYEGSDTANACNWRWKPVVLIPPSSHSTGLNKMWNHHSSYPKCWPFDPFLCSFVLPDTSRKSRQKTRVLRRTVDPAFNHTMVYDGIRESDLAEACVELTVWDRDRLASNLLGGLRLGAGTGTILAEAPLSFFKVFYYFYLHVLSQFVI